MHAVWSAITESIRTKTTIDVEYTPWREVELMCRCSQASHVVSDPGTFFEGVSNGRAWTVRLHILP